MDIVFKNVNYIYQQKTPFAHHALKDISFNIKKGSFTAIIGHTGSGKSTLIQQLNGIIRPTSGEIKVGPYLLTNEKNKEIKQLRQHIGIVFQYPEHQLFEETVKKDILFGPKNFGLKRTDNDLVEVLQQVGLEPHFLERSPFELSGGQMRRVAIASILISRPSVLVLDEPTAGLDPHGKHHMMELFHHLHKENDQTTILVTHDMEDALRYADQVVVLNKGSVEMIDHPQVIFKQQEKLKELGLDVPEIVESLIYMQDRLGFSFQGSDYTAQSIGKALSNWLKEGAKIE